MIKVDDEQLALLEEKARKDLPQDQEFVGAVNLALAERGKTAPSELEAVISRTLDLISYRLRKFLSGRELSPLALVAEYERILAQSKAEVAASLRGLSVPEDEVARRILQKLKDDLKLLENLKDLSSARAERALFVSYLENGLERTLLAAPVLLREADKTERAEAEFSLLWKRLLQLVREGKLYRFEAKEIADALRGLPEAEARRSLRRAIIQILERR